jgi:hypothetical protein
MKFNEAGQEFHVIAFDGFGRVTGAAASITCELAIDGASRSATSDSNPTEIGTTGEYVFSLSQAETNGYELSFTPTIDIAGTFVKGLPANVIYTTVEQAISDRTDLLTP